MTALPADDLDPDRIAALRAALGDVRLAALLMSLRAELAGLAVAADDAALAGQLHKLQGSSGSLGLPRLAAVLTRCEMEVGNGPIAAGAIESERANAWAALARHAPGLVGDHPGDPEAGSGAAKR